MPDTTNKTSALDRRALFARTLASGAAFAAGTAPIAAAATAVTHDPIIDLIRQEKEIRTAGVKLEDRALVMERDATDEQLEDPVFCAEIEALEARGEVFMKQANDLIIQIDGMIPQSIAGAIMLIEHSGCDYANTAIENALTGLRAIAARAAA
jgi:hypothetical protein